MFPGKSGGELSSVKICGRMCALLTQKLIRVQCRRMFDDGKLFTLKRINVEREHKDGRRAESTFSLALADKKKKEIKDFVGELNSTATATTTTKYV